jgi:hypothetical protein
MNLTDDQKKAILKAIQAGKCTPEDITPALHVVARLHDGSDFVLMDGEAEPVTMEQFDLLKTELQAANVFRQELGLPLHSVHCLHFENYS